MISNTGKKIIVFAIFLFWGWIGSYTAGAETHSDSLQATHSETHDKDKKLNVGELIFDHILDAHDWHIFSIGETHVTIPLPVILIDNGKLVAFSSAKFHHGHESYKGYKLMSEGKYKGKVIAVDSNGEFARLPLDFSITKNVAALFILTILLFAVFFTIAKRYKQNPNRAPKGLQSLLEPLIFFVRDNIAITSIGEKKYQRFMPYLLSAFFFIFFGNLMGLIPFFPGGANLTGSISITLVLALFTFFTISFTGNKGYWKHIYNTPGVPWWLKFPLPLMPIIEFVGILTKPFVLMLRLFANISAGHIIILSLISLIFVFGQMSPTTGYLTSIGSVAFSVFMSALELLVAFIQAYVFTLLSAIYIGMANQEHEPGH